MEKYGFENDVISPEWENNMRPDNWTYEYQVDWEVKRIRICERILFWIPRDMEKLPCLTTNIEFGTVIGSKKKLWVGGNNVHNNYIKTRLEMSGRKFYDNLEEMIKQICGV